MDNNKVSATALLIVPTPSKLFVPPLQTVAERIADDLGDVRRNWVVQEIQWGEQGISIRSESGKTLHADAVILTVSLGVLKVPWLLTLVLQQLDIGLQR